MRRSLIVLSALHFLLLLFLLGLGGVLLALFFLDAPRYHFIYLLQKDTVLFAWTGLSLIGFGILLMTVFSYMYRRPFFQIKLESVGVKVDADVLKGFAKTYWVTLFPHDDLSVEVLVRKDQTIELICEMPASLPSEIQEELLLQAERDLATLFKKSFGYTDPLVLTISLKE